LPALKPPPELCYRLNSEGICHRVMTELFSNIARQQEKPRVRLRLAQIEAAMALALAWVLVFVVPFRWTVLLFGAAVTPGQVEAADISSADIARALGVAQLVNRMDRRLPWHNTCLVRALAGRLLLARRGLRGGIVRLGVSSKEGRISAHAWLMMGATILLGGAEAAGFEPLADIAG
jgi:hypothetical protein